ncbi:MAG: signal peptide peptidase SppA [Cytophagales bacterium]|nr:MAG: signal peptide peptidase SppA [Cytophagales bacterium]
MWSFIKSIFSVFFALILFFIVAIFLIIGMGAAATKGDKVVSVEKKSILVFNFDKEITEIEIENPLEGLDLPISSGNTSDGLIKIKATIENAIYDENIEGIFLKIGNIQAGASKLEEIRESLQEFKNQGKFIYAYSETYSEGAYFLASVANKIYLNPVGLLEFNGIGYTNMFLKGTLEKLEIEPQIFRVGKYKSAVEPLILDKMSDANRTQTLSFISSINNNLLNLVSESRNIPFKELKNISDSMLVRNAKDALRLKIVTNLGYYDEVLLALKSELKLEKDKKLNFISYSKYKNLVSLTTNESSKDKIVVIVADGEIEGGKGDEETIGSESISEEIRKARLDSNVKAVVLRINSPGGSALASDVMWREVVLTANSKPIIASMSDVAASGGYYMAMGCTKILAKPSAITGSIGVFGLILNIENFLKSKAGITSDGVKTGRFSDIGTMSRPCTAYEKSVIQAEVEGIYKDFVVKAADGRKMKYENLEAIASGRVWSGAEAKENGLIDDFGGINDAIILAANLAKIDSTYSIEYRPNQKDFFEKIVEQLSADAKILALKSELGVLYRPFVAYKDIEKRTGIQAMLPIGSKMEW